MRGITALFGLLFLASGASAQQFSPVSFKEHPTPPDVEVIFTDMEVTLDNIEEPAAQLAASEWSFNAAQGFHTRIESLKTVLKNWTPILRRTGEMPTASDLFTIYSSFRDIQSSCDGLASVAAAQETQASVASMKNATIVIRNLTASADLLTALDPAVYDAIQRLETRKSDHSNSSPIQRKR